MPNYRALNSLVVIREYLRVSLEERGLSVPYFIAEEFNQVAKSLGAELPWMLVDKDQPAPAGEGNG